MRRACANSYWNALRAEPRLQSPTPACSGELGVGVGDDDLDVVETAGCHRRETPPKGDRAGRSWWGELHEPDVVGDDLIHVEHESDAHVEISRPVDVGDGYRDDFDFPVRDVSFCVGGLRVWPP